MEAVGEAEAAVGGVEAAVGGGVVRSGLLVRALVLERVLHA